MDKVILIRKYGKEREAGGDNIKEKLGFIVVDG